MRASDIYRGSGMLAASQTPLAVAGRLGPAHRLYEHLPLWSWCNPKLANPYPPEYGMPDLFTFPKPGADVEQAAALTRFLVFLGAAMTPELALALALPDHQVFILEPDPARMEAFLAGLDPARVAGKRVLFLQGDPDTFFPPLLAGLPPETAELGSPVFFVQEGLEAALPEYVARAARLLELFYYRQAIYPLDGQDYQRGLPIRPMAREAIFDRVKHAYENLVPCLGAGVLNDLRNALPGHTAILVAAGPALQGNLEFIRKNRDRAVVIAVNSALKPLLAAGIEPHFVVINDTSVASEASFTGLSPLDRTALVGHCLSASGGGIFRRAYFFGNFPGQPFRARDNLLLHGSVITTAFSLAEYLGCAKAVLAGVQLASTDPRLLNYSPHSPQGHRRSDAGSEAVRHRFPELCPVRAVDGSLQYTSLNFLDAAQWFADRIRLARLEVVNITPASILTGPNIVHDPDPVLPERPDLAGLPDTLPKSSCQDRLERVADTLRAAMAEWKGRERLAREALREAADPKAPLGRAEAFIAACDQDNTSFMAQRFEDFDNALFHALYFDAPSQQAKRKGAAYFCARVERMSKALMEMLIGQHKALTALKSRSGG